MARPREEQPTAGELEVLKVLWSEGPRTVREVMDRLNARRRPPRAYTSVMSLLNVMAEKGLVHRRPHEGRAYVYEARLPRETTLGSMVNDLLGRAFEGSASSLVARLLDESHPTDDELDMMRQAIDEYQRKQEPD